VSVLICVCACACVGSRIWYIALRLLSLASFGQIYSSSFWKFSRLGWVQLDLDADAVLGGGSSALSGFITSWGVCMALVGLWLLHVGQGIARHPDLNKRLAAGLACFMTDQSKSALPADEDEDPFGFGASSALDATAMQTIADARDPTSYADAGDSDSDVEEEEYERAHDAGDLTAAVIYSVRSRRTPPLDAPSLSRVTTLYSAVSAEGQVPLWLLQRPAVGLTSVISRRRVMLAVLSGLAPLLVAVVLARAEACWYSVPTIVTGLGTASTATAAVFDVWTSGWLSPQSGLAAAALTDVAAGGLCWVSKSSQQGTAIASLVMLAIYLIAVVAVAPLLFVPPRPVYIYAVNNTMSDSSAASGYGPVSESVDPDLSNSVLQLRMSPRVAVFDLWFGLVVAIVTPLAQHNRQVSGIVYVVAMLCMCVMHVYALRNSSLSSVLWFSIFKVSLSLLLLWTGVASLVAINVSAELTATFFPPASAILFIGWIVIVVIVFVVYCATRRLRTIYWSLAERWKAMRAAAMSRRPYSGLGTGPKAYAKAEAAGKPPRLTIDTSSSAELGSPMSVTVSDVAIEMGSVSSPLSHVVVTPASPAPAPIVASPVVSTVALPVKAVIPVSSPVSTPSSKAVTSPAPVKPVVIPPKQTVTTASTAAVTAPTAAATPVAAGSIFAATPTGASKMAALLAAALPPPPQAAPTAPAPAVVLPPPPTPVRMYGLLCTLCVHQLSVQCLFTHRSQLCVDMSS
jgi:hypothetical protein